MENQNRPRLIGLDIYRGFLIWMMIFLHNLDSYSGDLQAIESSGGVASVIGKFIGRWGVFFFIITGYSNSLSIYRKFQDPEVRSRKVLLKSIIKAAILIAFDKVFCLLFAGESQGGGEYNFNEGPITMGIILGFIKTGTYQPPRIYDLFICQSAVTTISYILLSLTLIEVVMFKNRKNHKKYSNLIILSSIGLFLLIISPFLIQFLRPLWVIAIQNKNYGLAFLYGLLVGDVHPLLPNIGFGFIGAAFGLAYELRIPRKQVVILGSIFSIISILIGVIGYAIYGDIPFAMSYQTSPGRAMWLLMGVMTIPILIIYYFEFEPSENKPPGRLALNLQRFGKVSLTMFLIESFLVEILLLGISIVYPLADNLAILAVYGVVVIILTSYLLKIWEKGNYAGSAEWAVRKATQF